MALYIAVDMGGTKLLAASAEKDGNLIRRLRADTPLDLNEGLSLLKSSISDLSQNQKIAAIGVSVGGPIDWEHGIVSPLHQPQWRDVSLKSILESEFGCPVFIDVDTNGAVLAERLFGKSKAKRLLYFTVSTGVGGGFLVDGNIYRGANSWHPEVGHQSIHYRCRYPERVICECGAPDCLEALISGNGIQRIYHKRAEMLNDDEWQEIGYNLGQGLRNLAAIYTPDEITLGGGIAIGAAEKLINPAQKVLKEYLNIVPCPKLRLSRLGYDTALMGALALAVKGC